VKSEQLLTQGKIFEDDILAGPECTNNPAEEVPEPYDHAQNLTETLPIELGAKSLILGMYDVLRNDNAQPGSLRRRTLTPFKSRQLPQYYFLVRVSSSWILLPALISTVFCSVA
jgi:hypothetical protein